MHMKQGVKSSAFLALPRCCHMIWGIAHSTTVNLQENCDCRLQSRACRKKSVTFSSPEYCPQDLWEFDWHLLIAKQVHVVGLMWDAELSLFFFFLFKSAIAFNLAFFSACLSVPEVALWLSQIFKAAQTVCLKLIYFGLDGKGLWAQLLFRQQYTVYGQYNSSGSCICPVFCSWVPKLSFSLYKQSN